MQKSCEKGPRPSHLASSNVHFTKSDTEEDDKDSGPREEAPSWDVFKYYPKVLKTGSKTSIKFFERAAVVAKFCVYIILGVFILGGGILSKATILFAASQVNDNGPIDYCDYNAAEQRPTGKQLSATTKDKDRLLWYWCIFFAFAFPEVIALITGLYNSLFKKRKNPKKLNILIDILVILTTEALHTIGQALMFFLVLPELNSLQALALISSTCFLPSLLAVFSSRQQLYLIGDGIALGIQVLGIIIWLVPSAVAMTPQSRAALPFAVILMSCRWWTNYASPNSDFGFIRTLSRIKTRVQTSKGLIIGYSAAVRILVFFGSLILIASSKGHDPSSLFDNEILNGKYNVSLADLSSSTQQPIAGDDTTEDTHGRSRLLPVDYYYLPLMVLLIHVPCSWITFYSSKFAYRTLMELYGFCLPINLIVPATVIALVTLSAVRANEACAFHGFLPDHAFFDAPNHEDTADLLNNWYVWWWILTLPSQVWITRHILSPISERLATTERIFLIPSYDSLMIDQSIVLNKQIDETNEDNDDDAKSEASYVSRASTCHSSSNIPKSDRVTKIIACATMWHETAEEMTEFMGSILRLDMDQGAKRFTQGYYKVKMRDYYEFETHIFFDDAFRCMHGCGHGCKHDENETQINDFVMNLITTVKTSVEGLQMLASAPTKYPAPYGGRLEWTLPGKTKLIAHLKDNNKIRHRKRWSQVMYMYYLLGFRLVDQPIDADRKEIIAENTYLLTLDGDIDFRPSAVKVLVDLMKRDNQLGAACGRIHPIGSGPMVWFQKFEYAIGHWLQKSTEHTIGSVLCSPGCFSLFRAKALIQPNVMRKYAIASDEPRHYVQYDQGEDRWLCTLILQVGYRVEYSAASDSYTHAPENFNEFYNQRRRWIPSTIANIFDLLSSAKETRKVNDNISWLYILYQWIIMGSTILGPGTIFLMLVGAFVAAFNIGNWISFGYNLIPILIFVVVCSTCKADIQLLVAGIITAIYGLVMIVVLVGIMLQIAEDGWIAPTTILFFIVAGQLVVTGLLHPQEWNCLLCGLIYYVTVPSMYLVLIIYSVFNVNNVTWGTRDSKPSAVEGKKQSTNDGKEMSRDQKNVGKKDRGSIEFSLAGLFKCMLCMQEGKSEEDRKLEAIGSSLEEIMMRLDAMEKNTNGNEDARKYYRSEKLASKSKLFEKTRPADSTDQEDDSEQSPDDNDDNSDTQSQIYAKESHRRSSNFLVSPYWLQDERLRKGGVEFLSSDEENFWELLIEKYLYPIDEDKKKLAETAEGLKKLRDDSVFKFFMVNALFVLTVFLMQLNKDILHLEWPFGKTYNITYDEAGNEIHLEKTYLKLEPIGFIFIIGFIGILGIQFIAMLFHRFHTFTHILASTNIEWPCMSEPIETSSQAVLEKHADNIVDGLQEVVEINAAAVQMRHKGPVDPNRRKTIHDLTEEHEARVRKPATLDTLFRRNLDGSGNEISRVMSARMPSGVFEAFGNRRTTIMADMRQSQLSQPGSNNNSATNSGRFSSIAASESSYGYDNDGFVSDDYGANYETKNGAVEISQKH